MFCTKDWVFAVSMYAGGVVFCSQGNSSDEGSKVKVFKEVPEGTSTRVLLLLVLKFFRPFLSRQ